MLNLKSLVKGVSRTRLIHSVRYEVEGRIATVTLNRPHLCNAIDEHMPAEIEQCVEAANEDAKVKGYDLKKYAEAKRGTVLGSQEMPWDPYTDYKFMSKANEAYMSLWRSLKPTVAQINGDCVAGGTDIALCCDLTFIAGEARIGYPPARVWGCPTGAMWFYRLGMERAKRMLFTGQLISGSEAARIGLVGQSVPINSLQETVRKVIGRIEQVPTNQLFFQKQVINNAVEMLGLKTTQMIATVFDGMTRHTPEGVEFQKKCHQLGYKAAIAERDQA